MHRVLEHIDQHLDRTLELRELAAVAHFSSFHFHRLFSAFMGETLGEYLRRRRLEIAAMRLAAQPRVPILTVALGVGFGSAEAFARAFKSRFGVSASAWRQAQIRQRSNPDQAIRNADQAQPGRTFDHPIFEQRRKEIPMKVNVIDRAPAKVAYLRYTGPYGPPVAEFWQRIAAPWMGSHGLFGRARYGISHDDPGITAPEKCRYDACVEVAPDFVASGPAHVTTIPGGKYATAEFRGNAGEIEEAWASLLRDWLPRSGLQLDARPSFEYYPSDAHYDPKSGSFACQLVIPVMPL